MKEIKIISITEKGSKAINQHIEETKKLKLVHKLMYKKLGHRQYISNENPLTLSFQITNPYLQTMLKKNQVLSEINKALKKNGAIKNIDYKIEVL